MNSSLLEAIDNYCERTGPEIWSEPLNALTNLAFIAAGIWGLFLARRNRTGGFAELLAWMAILIGFGSGLFHTWANRLTAWGDIVPIALFVFTFTLFVLRRFLGFGWLMTVLIFVLFYAAAGFVTYMVPQWLVTATNGSTGYLPAFLALVVFGLWVSRSGHPAGKYILAGAGIFVVSVTFRIVDPSVCEAMPIGTHFLWHALNGLLLGVVLTAAALHGHPEAEAPSSFGRGSLRQTA
jgi:hypothetical protein